METIADRYDRLAGAFAAKIDAVPADRWDEPSPCEGWTARDIVRHVSETPGMFLGFVGQELGELPDDPAEGFASARKRVLDALHDPTVANAEYEGFMGRMTFAEGIDRFINFDLTVHAWDLAKAVGLDDRIDPADLDRLEEASKGFGDAMRGPGAFGPELEAPADADRQTRVLAFLGRAA
ncbi:MAG: TIGR03086 family protein [Acidimicrobiia bacterium]|nr:TIGR03086 family protein [Acidimicrobiia bacterium]